MNKESRIYIASHEGMIGSAVLRRLNDSGFKKLILRTVNELDLTEQQKVMGFFKDEKPEYVFLSTTSAGGIKENITHPAELIYNNLQIQNNVIHSAWKTGVKKLLFWGSSCMYPRDCPQPMKEEYLLSGKIEATSEPYAVAKIAGMKLCQSYNYQYGTNYIPIIPSDIYGPGDDFNLETSHFFSALIRRIHEAKIFGQKEVLIWGTGAPRRDCLHVDDLIDASILLLEKYDQKEIVNIGSGKDCSIGELAYLMRDIIGYRGNISFDKSKPDGSPQKFLDVSRIKKLGWSAGINIEDGIKQTYQWYRENIAKN
jgi:GDP-L-fucose synthase